MQHRMVLWVAGALAVFGFGCGDDGDDAGAAEQAIEVDVDVDATLVDVDDVVCRRNGTNIVGEGVVRNRGESPHHVSLSVRFVDADGVRVELVSDSVSDLEPRESARWSVTAYPGEAVDSVVRCVIDAEVS